MSSGVIVFLEIAVVLGLALVFGVRELRNLRRYDRERDERARLEKGAPPDGGPPVG